MYNSLENIPSETLQAELVRRGDDLASPRDNEAIGEVVRIG